MEYNIYIDESSIDNPSNEKMVIGSIFVDRKKVRKIASKIKEIQKKHNFYSEMKWSRVDAIKLDYYKELVDFLISLDAAELAFYAIIVDKKQVNYELYHQGDKELAFFKFAYNLLINKFKKGNTYYIFPDFKPTKNKERVADLKGFLERYIGSECLIKHMQAYESKENIFIQVADIFCGAVGYQNNDFPTGRPKDELANYVASKVGKSNLKFCSPLSENKFNIFCIRLN